MERVNTALLLFSADHDESLTELEISLKSCVPTLIMFPELMESFGKDISHVAPYYESEVDYLDNTSNTILKDSNLSAMPLLQAVSKILVNLLSLEYEANQDIRRIDQMIEAGVMDERGKPYDRHKASSTPPLPRLSIKIDISGKPSEFKTITSDEFNSEDNTNEANSAYTYKLAQMLQNGEQLTDVQKCNFKLVDLIARITSSSGMGG